MRLNRPARVVAFAMVVFGLSAAVGFLIPRDDGSQRQITLPDGSTLELHGADYGTNVVVGPLLGRVVHRLPIALQRPLFRCLGGERLFVSGLRSLPSPSLVVGCRWKPVAAIPTVPIAHAVLADGNGFLGGEPADLLFMGPPVRFTNYPCHSRHLELHVFAGRSDYPLTERRQLGVLRFRNPRRTRAAKGLPEPLPATKAAGDLEITLHQFSTGHSAWPKMVTQPGGGTRVHWGTRHSGEPGSSVIAYSTESRWYTNETWQVARAVLSDLAGQVVNARRMGSVEDAGIRYQAVYPSLWPEEVWRLRLELVRESGHRPSETFTWRQVPLPNVGATNHVRLQTNFAGISLTLERIARQPQLTNESFNLAQLTYLQLTHAPLPGASWLRLVEARTDSGQPSRLETSDDSPTEHTFGLRGFEESARSVDLTLALHLSRTVEFYVRPTVAAP